MNEWNKDHWHTSEDVHTFKKVFNLRLATFVDVVGEFDIIKLDKAIKTPDGVSTRDHIKKVYGEDAVTLIKKFLRMA